MTRAAGATRVALSTTEVRLLCFAHAGGGASVFRAWHGLLGPDVEIRAVVLPGREARWREAPHRRMADLVEATMRELHGAFDRPFAFFGHSMGAAVAYELCRRFFAEPGSGPVGLFVSGRRAPHLPPRRPSAHRLPRDDFVAHLRSLNGVPPEVMVDPELLDAFLPCLRADFEVNETYDPPCAPPLPIPVSAFLGETDPEVTVQEMLGWRDLTNDDFTLRVFVGDHFYLKSGQTELLAAIRHDLARALPGVA